MVPFLSVANLRAFCLLLAALSHCVFVFMQASKSRIVTAVEGKLVLWDVTTKIITYTTYLAFVPCTYRRAQDSCTGKLLRETTVLITARPSADHKKVVTERKGESSERPKLVPEYQCSVQRGVHAVCCIHTVWYRRSCDVCRHIFCGRHQRACVRVWLFSIFRAGWWRINAYNMTRSQRDRDKVIVIKFALDLAASFETKHSTTVKFISL